MIKADISTVEGRQKLVNRTIHESHLEGHEVSQELRALYQNFVDGTMTMKEIKQSLLKGITKVA